MQENQTISHDSQASEFNGLPKHYEIIKELGRGGMGIVYLALDTRLERQVAIKILSLSPNPGSADQEALSRFLKEAKAVARLTHPHIVQIYDLIQHNDSAFMVMEYIEGKSLADLITIQQFPPILAATIGNQIAQALSYVHEKGIVHRDIKPGNIMLNRKGEAKLMDFGIAQMDTEGAKLTQAGSMIGSFYYASPEQLKDSSTVDVQADIYSLGITLYEILAGKVPYQATQLSLLLVEILSDQTLPSVREFNTNVPEPLALVLQQAIAKNKSERFQTMADFALALNHILGGLPKQTLQLDFGQTILPERSDVSAFDSTQPLNKASNHPLQSTHIRRTQINLDLIRSLERSPNWIRQLTQNWKSEEIRHLNLRQVFEKIMDMPLVGNAFSGLVLIEKQWACLVSQGIFVGLVDLVTGQDLPENFEQLPLQPESMELRFAPEGQAFIPVLIANILGRHGEAIQTQLDSSLLNLNLLIDELQSPNDPFTGYLVCHTPNNVIFYGYDQGQLLFSALAQDDPSLKKDSLGNIKDLFQQTQVVLHIYRAQPLLVGPSLKAVLKRTQLKVSYTDPQKTTLAQLVDLNEAEFAPHLIREVEKNLKLTLDISGETQLKLGSLSLDVQALVKNTLVYQLAHWLIFDYFFKLHQTGHTTSLKYIYSWLAAIESFSLETELADKQGETYRFSLVSQGTVPGESNAKILHLLRVGPGSSQDIENFIVESMAVKAARSKTGDIGGAIYLALQPYEAETLKIFYDKTVEPRKGIGLAALDKLTRYKGFVRMGMGRGFHLNLLEYQSESHDFEVIAPTLR